MGDELDATKVAYMQIALPCKFVLWQVDIQLALVPPRSGLADWNSIQFVR